MSEETKYPCEKCDKEFGAPATLRIHVNNEHKDEVEKEEIKVVTKKSKKK